MHIQSHEWGGSHSAAMFSMLSERGFKLTVFEGFKFSKGRRTQYGQKWRCTNRKCSAHLFTDDGGDVLLEAVGIHDHEPCPTLHRQYISNSLKRKAIETLTEPPAKVITKEIVSAPAYISRNVTRNDMDRVRRNLNCAKKSKVPTVPKCIADDHDDWDSCRIETAQGMVRVKLYHFPLSGPSRGAMLAIRQAGVDVDVEIIDLFKKEQLRPDFIKINPQHTVPTLVDGDFTLWDGHAIAQYLVNSYGKDDNLYPRDSKKRAVIDHRLFFDIGVLYARIREICFPVLFHGVTEVATEKVTALETALGWVEGFLSNSPWVAGPNLSIADTAFLASITSIVAVGYNPTKFPLTVAWLERCKQHVKGWEENHQGATLFGEAVRAKLAPGQFT